MAGMGASTERRRAARVVAGILVLGAVVVAGSWAYGPGRQRPDRVVDLAAVGERAGGGTSVLPPAADAPFRAGVLTPDGADEYRVSSAGGGTVVTAPAANVGSNLRTVLWRDGDAVAADQQACATFDSADADQQPGIALRIRSGGGRIQAITVTKNVWFGYYWRFNFHVMDSAAPEPYQQFGSTDLASAFLRPDGTSRPYPWRICALAVGDTVRFVAWPASDPPPAWDDPAHGGRAQLPAGWGDPGRPGLYVGHLRAGHSLEYRAISTQPL